MQELPKQYDPATIQKDIDARWQSVNAFHAEPTDPGTPYSIVIPPPNVTAALHLGHALNNTLQDILTRVHRMQGDNTVWLPGTDHAGIATQTVVEKRVIAETGKRRTDFQRDEFVAKIQSWKDEYEGIILGQLKAMGASCDWDRCAFTMDEPRAKAVREAFFQLFKDGLIYRGKRLVNWDPVTQTALADDEVENEEIDGFFYYLKYPLVSAREPSDSIAGPVDAIEYITVATTRPETMLGDTAVAINPRDPRAASLRGKFVKLPIVNRLIPIIEDDYVVMPASLGGDPADPKAEFATGFLKVTPAHDPNDWEIGIRHKLLVINVMALDASISDKFGWTDLGDAAFVLGKSREEARQLIVDWFKKANLLEDVKPYKHSVGHSYRSHVPIEPYLSDQWYLKVTDDKLAGRTLRALAPDQWKDASSSSARGMGVSPMSSSEEEKDHEQDAHATGGISLPFPSGEDRGEGRSPGVGAPSDEQPSPQPSPAERGSQTEGGLRFYPQRYAKNYAHWNQNIRDWCISRQLWWGHRIPVWSKTIASPSESFIESARKRKGRLAIMQTKDADLITIDGREVGCAKGFVDLEKGMAFHAICLRETDAQLERELNEAGYHQDPDVLDTWFSSALWPMSTLGWPQQSTIDNPQSPLNVWNPTSVLCTAREIITLWVSRMVMFNLYFLDRLPFTDVFIHAMIMDGEGRKMSKSLGNGVDPLDIISLYGVDAMRMTLAMMATNTQDVRMPVTKDEATGKNTSPKFDEGRSFCVKLFNVARFVMGKLAEKDPDAAASAADASSTTIDELKWSMADRWIVSRFNRTVEEALDALSVYRFDRYAKACYDFVERDFSDWYVESSKALLKDPTSAPQTRAVLAAVFDGTLRLLHPVIPYVTELLWEHLNAVAPSRGLPGRIDGSHTDDPSKTPMLIKAPFPKKWDHGEGFSQAAEHIWPRLQELVVSIRNIKSQYKIEPRRNVPVSIKAPGDSARQIESHKAIIEQTAACTIQQVGPDIAPDAQSARATAAGCEVFVHGLVDESADKERATKRIAELTGKRTALTGRLNNAGYVAKAPPKLIQETKDQLAAVEAELVTLGRKPE